MWGWGRGHFTLCSSGRLLAVLVTCASLTPQLHTLVVLDAHHVLRRHRVDIVLKATRGRAFLECNAKNGIKKLVHKDLSKEPAMGVGTSTEWEGYVSGWVGGWAGRVGKKPGVSQA